MQIKNIIYLLVLVLFTACQSQEIKPIKQVQFFDLKTYFAEEQIRLKAIKSVVKKATIDGAIEEKTQEGVNLVEELALFVESDINKVAWLDKYEVDSVFQNQKLIELNYKAKDDQLKTNYLSIKYKNKEVEQIEIKRKTSSLAADLEQKLIYQSMKGYSIESYQKTSLSDPHVLALDVQFVQ